MSRNRESLGNTLGDNKKQSDPESPPSPATTASGELVDSFLDAVKGGDQRKVKTLIKTEPLLVTTKYPNGMTALHWAARCGRRDVAKMLVAARTEVDAKSEGGVTPLH